MSEDMRVAWVTGASSGIGEALAITLSKGGWAVILSGRRVAALEAVAGRFSGPSLVLPFEATDYDALPAIAETAIGWRGRIDLLVNNAGVSQRSLALDTAFETYRTIMEIDFMAPLRLTQLVLPHMVARKTGRIAVVSSLAGKIGSPLRTGYCAAKHALMGYFDALRAEVELAYGVQVTTVTPGSIRTAVAANALQGDGSVRGVSDQNIDAGIDPMVAAEQILTGMEAGQREIVVAEGAELAASQLKPVNPELLFELVAKEGARLAAARTAAGAGFRPEPAKVAQP